MYIYILAEADSPVLQMLPSSPEHVLDDIVLQCLTLSSSFMKFTDETKA